MRAMRSVIAGGAGGVVALMAAALVPYTSAIEAPMGFFEPFRSLGSVGAGTLAWEVLVVFGLGLIVPAVAVLVPLFGTGLANRWPHLAVFFFSCLVCFRILIPAALGSPIILPSEWWQVSPELALLLAVLFVWRFRTLWPNNSSKPTPLRGAA